MNKTLFEISKMDCPSEETMIRTRLSGNSSIRSLEFDLENRQLAIFHEGESTEIESAIAELSLGDRKLSTERTGRVDFVEEKNQRRVLWSVLLLNFTFFAVEMTSGLFSGSMGLVADSLDMLADSFVYGLSLLAVGGTLLWKKRVASTAGFFQMLLALIGFAEVIRRFIAEEAIPDATTMIVVSVFALIANALCLYLLQKSKSKEEVHMKASMIFTSNDIIINGGVIIAGISVQLLSSSIPDLIIGSVVFALVIQGAFRILKLGK